MRNPGRGGVCVTEGGGGEGCVSISGSKGVVFAAEIQGG